MNDGLYIGDKCRWLAFQRNGKLEDDVDGRLIDASFDETYVIPLNIGLQCQLLLGQPCKLPSLA
ncbi:hypothetical protein D3C71_985060 [compost metagenome]